MAVITPTIYGTYGADSLVGTAGNDTIAGYNGNDTLFGQEGDDYIVKGMSGNSYLDGGDGNDTLAGSWDNDTLVGGLGADLLSGDSGMTGTVGKDVFVYTSLLDSTTNARDQIDDFAHKVDKLDLSHLVLEGKVIYIDPTNYANVMNVSIKGTDFSIEVRSDFSSYNITKDDIYVGDQHVTFTDVKTDSTPVVTPVTTNAATAATTSGVDASAVNTDITHTNAAPTPTTGIFGNGTISAGSLNFSTGGNLDISTNVFSTSGVIKITGSDNNNVLTASSGNDSVTALGGDDYITANAGDDTVLGGDGNDTMFGNVGRDVLYGNVGNDGLFGGKDDDNLFGGQGNDTIQGNMGNDFIQGNMGNDFIHGGAGDDSIHGGAGDDILNGGAGNDTLNSGIGSDIFQFSSGNGVDYIVGFEGAGTPGGDIIQISAAIYSTVEQVLSHISYTAEGHAVIDLGGNNFITVVALPLSLTVEDFAIGG